MSISLYDASIGTYTQILGGLANVMKKGVEHCAAAGIDLQSVVDSRLADDMANFHFQVTSAVHHSQGAIAALKSGEFGPPRYDACGYEALQSMVDEALASLGSEKREDIDALAGGQVTFKMGGMEIPFTNANFVLSFSLPNFYFHVTTAYDLLRSAGAPIGKLDYLADLRAGV